MYAVTNHRSGFEAAHKFERLADAERFFANEVETIGGPVELWELDDLDTPIRLRERAA